MRLCGFLIAHQRRYGVRRGNRGIREGERAERCVLWRDDTVDYVRRVDRRVEAVEEEGEERLVVVSGE